MRAVLFTMAALLGTVPLAPGRAPGPSSVKLFSTHGSYGEAPGARTLAGTGAPGFGGDGGSAAGAMLDGPAAVAESPSGELFVADAGNCRVREVATTSGRSFGRALRTGEIVTVAGGPCSDPRSDPEPSSVALDSEGDLFVSYGAAARVDELVAHSGSQFGLPLAADRLRVIAGTGNSGFGGDGGPATRAELDDPTGLAVDPEGDLIISDTGNCRIRLVASSSGTRFGFAVTEGHIYTVAGDGVCGSSGDGGPAVAAELWDPGALAMDTAGDILEADQGNRTVREIASHAGTFYGVPIAAGDISTVAGEGSYGPYLVDGLAAVGSVAELNFPTALAVDARGDLYIADGDMHVIRVVPASATILLGHLAQPDSMYSAAGAVSTGPGNQKTKWIQTRMLDPTGLAISPEGRLIFSDGGADVVRELPPGT